MEGREDSGKSVVQTQSVGFCNISRPVWKEYELMHELGKDLGKIL